MSSYFDLAAANPVLKEFYGGQRLVNLIYKNNPFWALVRKFDKLEGKDLPIPMIVSAGQGGSANFGYAQQNQTAVDTQSFALTTRTDYQLVTLQNQAMLASRSNRGAFISAIKLNVDAGMRNIVNRLAVALFRSGTGTIGQIGSISNGVITLSDPNTSVYFDVGQTLQADATDGGVTPASAVGYVIAVDTGAGTVTVSATGQGGSAGTPTAWAATNYLLVQGDLNARTIGIQAWIPDTAPATNDNFYGVNRSQNPTKLAGYRYPAGNLPIEEAIMNAERQMAMQGASVDHIFVNFATYSALANALVGRATTTMVRGPANIGFNALEINGTNGVVKIIADRNCPSKHAYLLQLDTWCLHSMDPAPSILTYQDGNKFYRLPNADAVELRIASYAALSCDAPGFNGVCLLPS